MGFWRKSRDRSDLTHLRDQITGGGQPAIQKSKSPSQPWGTRPLHRHYPPPAGNAKSLTRLGSNPERRSAAAVQRRSRPGTNASSLRERVSGTTEFINVCRKHFAYNCTGAEFYFTRGARRLSEERSCERRACKFRALERWTDNIDTPRVALWGWTCICRLIQSAGGGGGRKRHENDNNMS